MPRILSHDLLPLPNLPSTKSRRSIRETTSMELPRFLCAAKPSEAGLHSPHRGDPRKEAWNGHRAGVCLEAADGEEEIARGARLRRRRGQPGVEEIFFL
jgi:hypothetical protein